MYKVHHVTGKSQKVNASSEPLCGTSVPPPIHFIRFFSAHNNVSFVEKMSQYWSFCTAQTLSLITSALPVMNTSLVLKSNLARFVVNPFFWHLLVPAECVQSFNFVPHDPRPLFFYFITSIVLLYSCSSSFPLNLIHW